jgi:hypothetical protein
VLILAFDPALMFLSKGPANGQKRRSEGQQCNRDWSLLPKRSVSTPFSHKVIDIASEALLFPRGGGFAS